MKESEVCVAKQVLYRAAVQVLQGATWVMLMFVVANFAYTLRDDEKKELPVKKKTARIREIPLAKLKPEPEKPTFVKSAEETASKENIESR